MGRPEDSRVKIPALVHFTRLGYKYMSIKDKTRGLDYDPDTNIFYALFTDAINRINGVELSVDDAKKIIEEIKIKLDNDDLGKSFYQLLKEGINGLQLIDFNRKNSSDKNSYVVVTELPYESGDDKQRGELMHFDYIVSNPPFNVDFSDNRDTLAGDSYKERFWAGVPAVPKKDLDSMDIYLLFIQHIIFSMKESGKAAIVVPTGFLTRKNKIEKEIKKYIIDKKMLKGVISMPSNIFANTGTNVSIIFLDAENENEEALLVDATDLGEKVKIDGKNQKTVLSAGEIEEIITTFSERKEKESFSVLVSVDKIESNKYSFSAGQYFVPTIEYVALSEEEFKKKIDDSTEKLNSLFTESFELKDEINKLMRRLHYDL